MKQYCKNCGKATDYSVSVPKFCSGCGSPFGGSKAISSSFDNTKKQTPSQVKVSDDDDYDDDDGYEGSRPYSTTPRLSMAGIQIIKDQPKKVTLGEVAGTGSTNLPARPKEKKMSKKQFLEEFKKEAGGIPAKAQPRIKD